MPSDSPKQNKEAVKFTLKPLLKEKDNNKSDNDHHGDPVEFPTSANRFASATITFDSNTERTKIGKRFSLNGVNIAKKYDEKKVGLGEVAAGNFNCHGNVEDHEERVRKKQKSCILTRFTTTFMATILVFLVYLITLETMMNCAVCVGLTIYWYEMKGMYEGWEGSNMNWVVLGFAVVTPLTVSITLAFRRRERALYEISRIRSLCFQIYLAHAIWNWKNGTGRDEAMTAEGWREHTDKVLEQLVGIGDELCRFLTLPTCSRSYHRMMKSGRRKAADIVEVAYRLLDSLYTQRIVKLSVLTETLKDRGLSATEASRMRQYERFIGEAIENLRMIKMYRTPQALRSFGRFFTLVLPAFYAPSFAQLASDLHSLTMGIFFAILTPLVLTALFETMQVIEDPFVGWVTLDGIDVNEEMEILHFHQLMSARTSIFPDAPPFEERSKAAIVSQTTPLETSASPAKGFLNGSSRSRVSSISMDGSHRISHFAADLSGNKGQSISVSARSQRTAYRRPSYGGF